jgi:hypothetical protein
MRVLPDGNLPVLFSLREQHFVHNNFSASQISDGRASFQLHLILVPLNLNAYPMRLPERQSQ